MSRVALAAMSALGALIIAAPAEPPPVDLLPPRVVHIDLPAASCDLGEHVYLRRPYVIVEAIGRAEGVPSYGNVLLARRYGGHRLVPASRGREATARLLHRYYRAWVRAGRPGLFLEWLAVRYAPLGAANDPLNLNVYWLDNVLADLAARVAVGDR